MTAFNMILLLISAYMVNKVFKLAKFQDMTLLLNTISITLALIFFLAYNIMMIISTYEINDIDGWNETFMNSF
jgi:hypothetical protein